MRRHQEGGAAITMQKNWRRKNIFFPLSFASRFTHKQQCFIDITTKSVAQNSDDMKSSTATQRKKKKNNREQEKQYRESMIP
jgi:hypothetical protein